MSVPPAHPRKRREEALHGEVLGLAAKLGLDEQAVQKVIQRAGSLQDARSRLSERLKKIERQVLENHERSVFEEEIAKRREVYEREREMFAASRQSARDQRSLGERLDQTVAAISVLSTARASRLQLAPAHGAPDDPERQAPPPAPQIDLSPHLSVIAHHVEAIEHELDVARGQATPRLWRKLSARQTDEYIVQRFPGVHKRDLARDCPELGSEQAIERARRAHGLRAVDGLPREEKAA